MLISLFRMVVQRLYDRLGTIAASRLKELSSMIDRRALAEAIRGLPAAFAGVEGLDFVPLIAGYSV